MDLLNSLLGAWLYPVALAVISLFVFGLEAAFGHRKEQRQFRPWLWSDVLHIVFNGHFLGLILFGIASYHVLPLFDGWLGAAGLTDVLYRNAASEWPVLVQVLVALVVIDFFQWCVHNSLHRVPFLWELHKTHHSVQDGEMDWIVSFRFQWTEVVLYRAVLFFPLAWFGFGFEAVMFHAIFGTLIGHLNHANLDWDYGPLKYVFNNPKMHIWHHDYDGDTRTTVNFGIIFSTWDYLFGTAKVPDQPPAKLGFAGVETFPRDFFSQQAWPLPALLPDAPLKPAATVLGGLLILGTGFAVSQPPSGPATPMLGEVAATSQPTTNVRFFAYAGSVDEANQRLDAFGSTAVEAGFARPEWMVSADELAGALGSDRLVLLDVRPMERFEEGHLPSAQPVDRPDYSQGDPAPGVSRSGGELQAMLRSRGVSQGDVVVVYGDGGPEPYRLWWTLREMVGVEVRVLDGGMAAWMGAGHKLAAGSPQSVEPGDVAAPSARDRSPTLWADVEAFAADAVVLDTRSEEEFTGAKHHKKAARAGRMPGAQHLDWWAVWRDGLTDQRMQEPEALRAAFASYGIARDDEPVLTMCQSGTRSATVIFALLQAGHDEEAVRNYDGSWAEYSRLESLPIDSGPCTSC